MGALILTVLGVLVLVEACVVEKVMDYAFQRELDEALNGHIKSEKAMDFLVQQAQELNLGYGEPDHKTKD